MNKELREDLEHLIICEDKSITPDLRDDIKMALNYIDKLEQDYKVLLNENEKLKEQCKEWKENHKAVCIQRDNILNNIVKDKETRIDYKSRIDKAIEYIETENSIDNEIEYTTRLLDILRGEDNERN